MSVLNAKYNLFLLLFKFPLCLRAFLASSWLCVCCASDIFLDVFLSLCFSVNILDICE